MSGDQLAAELSIAEQVDAACDRFEADWRSGRAPRIEDCLAATPETEHQQLLCALLSVEVELRLKARERVTSRDYERRFPDHKQLVRDVFATAARSLQERKRSDAAPCVAPPGTHETEGGTVSVSEPAADTSVSRPSAPPESQPPTAPTRIGRFDVLEVLGEGAFGTVYRARGAIPPGAQAV